MELNTATVVELKAAAYDELARIEQAQHNIKVINEELYKRNQPKVEEKEVEGEVVTE